MTDHRAEILAGARKLVSAPLPDADLSLGNANLIMRLKACIATLLDVVRPGEQIGGAGDEDGEEELAYRRAKSVVPDGTLNPASRQATADVGVAVQGNAPAPTPAPAEAGDSNQSRRVANDYATAVQRALGFKVGGPSTPDECEQSIREAIAEARDGSNAAPAEAGERKRLAKWCMEKAGFRSDGDAYCFTRIATLLRSQPVLPSDTEWGVRVVDTRRIERWDMSEEDARRTANLHPRTYRLCRIIDEG